MSNLFKAIKTIVSFFGSKPPKKEETPKITKEGSKMKEINLSIDFDYHSQRNNIFIPYGACNATSGIMYLKSGNIDFYVPKTIEEAKKILKEKYGVKEWSYPEGKPLQEEDYLISILQSPKAYDIMREIAPWAISQGYPPNEVHSMLSWGINELAGKEVSYFNVTTSMKEWVYDLIIRRKPLIIAGKFTEYGHIVCLAGVAIKQNENSIKKPEDVDLNKVGHFIVDDPYGDWHTKYKSHKGNNIKFTVEELMDLTETRHSAEAKWTHRLK